MLRTSWVILIAALLLGAAVWLLLASGEPAPAPVTAPAAPGRSASPAAAAGNPVEDTTAETPATPAANVRTPEAIRAAAPAVSGLTGIATVRGRCIDSAHRPVSGCTILCSSFPAGVVPKTMSGMDGSFELALDLASQNVFAVTVATLGGVPVRRSVDELRAGAITNLGDVVVMAGTRLRGRVVDAANKPQAEVGITFTDATVREGTGPLGRVAVKSGVNGAFDTALAPGSWDVSGTQNVYRPQRLLVLAADEQSVEVVVEALAPRGAIRGTVVGTGGEVVANAHVTALGDEPAGWGPSSADTDEQGEFVVEATRATGATALLEVQGAGYRLWRSPARLPFPSDGVRVQLEPLPRERLQLRRGDDGGAVTAAHVQVSRGGPRTLANMVAAPFRIEGPFADGIVELPMLFAGEHDLWVDPIGADLAPTAVLTLHAGTGSTTVVTVSTRRTRLLQVRMANGAPAQDSTFQLIDGKSLPLTLQQARRLSERRQGVRSMSSPQIEGRTGKDGDALLSGPGDRPLSLLLLGPGHTPLVVPDVRLDLAAPLQITVEAPCSLRLQLVPPAALQRLLEIAGGVPLTVALDPDSDADRSRSPSRPHISKQPVAADGVCSFAEVAAGSWLPRLRLADAIELTLPTVQVAAGAASELTIDLQPLLPGQFTGVLSVDGQRVVGARVTLTSGQLSGRNYLSAQTDASGRFEMLALPGAYRVHVSLRGGTANGISLHVPEPVIVHAGERCERDLVLQATRRIVRLVDAAGAPAGGVPLVSTAASGERVEWLPTGVDGRATLVLTAGTYALRVRPRALCDASALQDFVKANGMAAAQAAWIEVSTLVAGAEAPQELEVRLPPEWDR